MGRDAFEKEVWAWKTQCGGFTTQKLRRLGASCDWSSERFTLDKGLGAEWVSQTAVVTNVHFKPSAKPAAAEA
jgi:valyl-tRNA synthetase